MPFRLPSAGRFGTIVNGLVFALVVGGGVWQVAGGAVDHRLWLAIFAVYIAVNAGRLRRSGVILLTAAVVLAAAIQVGADLSVADGVRQASVLFAFLLVLQYLARLANGSPDVAEGARMIVSRPPGQRYAFLTVGTHILSVLLQLGGMILVMALLATRIGEASREAVRLMAMASLRGFAATALWSPLSLSVLVTLSGVDGVPYAPFAAIGLTVAALYLLLGYRLERRQRAPAAEAVPIRLGPDERRVLRVLLVPIALLILLAFTLVALFDLRLLQGVLAATAILAATWTAGLLGKRALTPRGALRTMAGGTGAIANEMAIICGAITIGTLASGAVLHWDRLAAGLTSLEATAIAGLLPLAIYGGGLIALNPLVTVTLLAGALNAVWPEGAKLWLALALTWGWAATACGTPFTANMLIAGRQLQTPAHVLALAWNGRFTALTLAIFALLAAAGTYYATRGGL